MITYEYLPVTFEELPVSKIFDVGKDYIFEFVYNPRYDKIAMNVSDTEGNLLYATRLTYGNKLIHAVVEGLTVDNDLVAMNLSDVVSDREIDSNLTAVASGTFGGDVKVYLV